MDIALISDGSCHSLSTVSMCPNSSCNPRQPCEKRTAWRREVTTQLRAGRRQSQGPGGAVRLEWGSRAQPCPPAPHTKGGRGVSGSLTTQQGPDGSEAPTRSGWCFHSGRQMARAQNLLALPTLLGPKPWSGSPCVGLEGGEGGPCGPGLGLGCSLPDCGGLWELPCEGSVSTSVSQGVRGHSV